MRYRITHTTKYQYSESVPLCHNKLHLTPRPLVNQECLEYRLIVVPEPTIIDSSEDCFGNQVDYFSLATAHRSLAITSISLIKVDSVSIPNKDTASVPWEKIAGSSLKELDKAPVEDPIQIQQLKFDSPYINRDQRFDDYARESFTKDRPILDACLELTSRIHEDFEYDPRTTSVSTPIEQVFEQRSGVCQDFAHLQIACLRSIGLPARYVSGYLRTVPPEGKPRLIGADASHAWLSVYCGPLGWIDFDPTNNLIPGPDHVTVAHGRDYADVCPIQGVFMGGGDHSMSVSVDVALV